MTISTFSSTMIGWVAVATGVVGLLAAASIFLFFGIGQPFGTLNDILNALLAILSTVLAWMLFTGQQVPPLALNRVTLVIAVVGVVVAVVGSALALSGATGWYLAGLYLATGSGLIGLWLLGLNYAAWQGDSLPHSLIIFGLISGVIMALGLVAIPGVFRGIDTQAYELTPFNAIWWASTLGFLVLYPVWCILLGRFLLLKA